MAVGNEWVSADLYTLQLDESESRATVLGHMFPEDGWPMSFRARDEVVAKTA
jgi:hypothetical protein|tara:strand:- start:450 stop:605 length:156 start_codon:yes stop_codon:yes gene_type:complete